MNKKICIVYTHHKLGDLIWQLPYIKAISDHHSEKVDLIVGPTSPTPAYPIGDKIADPVSMYLGDLYTVSANLAGIAGISIPCGFSKTGLPIGLQLQAPAFEEERLLQAAHMFQQQTDWHTKRPSLKN